MRNYPTRCPASKISARRGWFALLGLLAFLSGCATGTVNYDFERSVDFSRFQTFSVDDRAVRAESQALALSEIVDRRFVHAIREELTAKGLREVSENPDLRVNFAVVTRTRTEITEDALGLRYNRFGDRRNRRSLYGPLWYQGIEINQYEEGTFIIDLVDREAGQLVWRGTSTRRVGWSAPDDAAVRTLVARILGKYPPS